jgi:uncharacterized protein (TIGR03118 family)
MNNTLTDFTPKPGKLPLFLVWVLTALFACHKSNVKDKDLRDFKQVNLVANKAKYNPIAAIDTTLQNAFGIAWSPGGIAWVNSVGGHVSDLYNSEGVAVRAPVNIPSPTDTVGGLPCGIVFNTTKGFVLPNGAPSAFIFTGFDGVLAGWNGPSGNNAKRVKAVPNSGYTGLAIAASGGQTFIYGANFKASRIDVWDSNFALVRKFSFKDPTLPQDYSPYNIQAVGDWLFVMYAQLYDGDHVEGKGKGFVSVFNADGSFVKRFASRGALDIPWGVTSAPGSFLEDKDMGDEDGGGVYGKTATSYNGGDNNNNHGGRDPKDPVILVGNFGDGRINVYTEEGKYLGQLQSHKQVIAIDGLWALSFPPSTSKIDPSRLYFSAGPSKETDGIFGYLIKQ